MPQPAAAAQPATKEAPVQYATKEAPVTIEAQDYVLSDGEPDRTGDIIEPKGWQIGNFSPVALFNHNRDAIVGKWESVRVKAGQLVGRLVLAEPGTSPVVDMVRALIRQNLLESISVGFRPLEFEPVDAKEPWGAQRFIKSELLEASVVAVPANPRARRIVKQFFPEDDFDDLFAKPGAMQVRTRSAPVTTGKLAVAATPSRGTPMPAKVSTGIAAKKNRIVAIKDELAAVAKRASENDDFEMSDEDKEAQDTLTAELAHVEDQLKRLEGLEKTLAGSIQLDDDDPVRERRSAGELITYERVEGSIDHFAPALAEKGETPIRQAARNARGFDHLVRLALVNFVGHVRHQDPMQVAADRYGKTKHYRDLEVILKAATAPAMTSVVGWAAELVGANVRALMDTIRPVSIYPRLAARGSDLTFDGVVPIVLPYRQYGTVPGSEPAATAYDKRLAGAFVGEGAPIPVRQGLFRSLTLNPYKMGVISAFTREMAFASTPAMEQIIREAIAEDTAWVLDMALFSDEAAVPGVRPAGLFAGLTALTPAAAGPDAALADIKALVGSVIGNGGGRSVVLIMNPLQAMSLSFMTEGGVFLFRDEVSRGSLMGVSLITSTTVPPGEVYCIDAGEFASGTGDPVFDVSDQATLHMDDGSYPANFTAPTVQQISGTGTPNVVAAPVRSLWQTASIAVRMLMNVSWGMRRSGMVAFMTGVNW